jgi:hypothetical protein
MRDGSEWRKQEGCIYVVLSIYYLFCFVSLYGCAEQSHGCPQAEKAAFGEAGKKGVMSNSEIVLYQ